MAVESSVGKQIKSNSTEATKLKRVHVETPQGHAHTPARLPLLPILRLFGIFCLWADWLCGRSILVAAAILFIFVVLANTNQLLISTPNVCRRQARSALFAFSLFCGNGTDGGVSGFRGTGAVCI